MGALNLPRPGDNLELDIQAHEAGRLIDELSQADAVREFVRLCSRQRVGGIPPAWIRDAVRQLGPVCLTILGRYDATAEDGATLYPVVVARIDRTPYQAGQRPRTAFLAWAPAAEGRAEQLLVLGRLPRSGFVPSALAQQCPQNPAATKDASPCPGTTTTDATTPCGMSHSSGTTSCS